MNRNSKIHEDDSEQLVTYAALHTVGVNSAAAALQYYSLRGINRTLHLYHE